MSDLRQDIKRLISHGKMAPEAEPFDIADGTVYAGQSVHVVNPHTLRISKHHAMVVGPAKIMKDGEHIHLAPGSDYETKYVYRFIDNAEAAVTALCLKQIAIAERDIAQARKALERLAQGANQ